MLLNASTHEVQKDECERERERERHTERGGREAWDERKIEAGSSFGIQCQAILVRTQTQSSLCKGVLLMSRTTEKACSPSNQQRAV